MAIVAFLALVLFFTLITLRQIFQR